MRSVELNPTATRSTAATVRADVLGSFQCAVADILPGGRRLAVRRQAAANVLAAVMPMQWTMQARTRFGAIGGSPDGQEMQGRILRQIDEKVGKAIDPLHRLTDVGI